MMQALTTSDLVLLRERMRRRRPPVFRGANLAAQTTTAREWILSGPYETGKTYAALRRLDTLLRATPKAQAAMIRKVRATMDGTCLVTWRRIIAQSGSGAQAFGGEKPQWYDYPNGARLWIGGLDNPQKTLSGERDWIYVNQAEELEAADWEILTRATTGRGAVTATPMLFGDCNPGAEDHWILDRVREGRLTLLESRHEDNPALYDEAGRLTTQGQRSISALDAMTGVRYLRGRLGQWVGAEGAFYAQLDERLHRSNLTFAPAGWRVWAAMDYGFAHPLSFGVFVASPEGAVHVLGLHHRSRWYIQQHHEAMVELCQDLDVDWQSINVYCGHDMWANRGGDDPETTADKFSARGWRLERATIARVPGARALGERLGNPEAGVAPSLFFSQRAWGIFATLTRMVPDPHNAEDVKKVDADANGRGGDDDYDMVRYAVMAAGSLADSFGGNPFGGYRG